MTDEKQKVVKEEVDSSAREYICPFCEKVYSTRAGLWKHLKKCSARPDSDDEPEGKDLSGGNGFSLFERDDEEEGYQCPECGYTAKRPFDKCPKCEAELEWN